MHPQTPLLVALLLTNGFAHAQAKTDLADLRPVTRSRACSGHRALLVLGQKLEGTTARALAQSLADVMHRPVTLVTRRRSAGVKAWLASAAKTGKHVDVVAHGDGIAFAVELLREQSPAKLRVYLIGARAAPALAADSLRLITNTRVHTRASFGGGDDKAGTESEDVSFEQFLKNCRGDVYGTALDELLRTPESRRRMPKPAIVEFRMVATDRYVGRDEEPLRPRFDLAEERKRLDAWLAKGENAARVKADPKAIRAFNRLTAARGGPANWYLRWYPGRTHYLDDAHRGFVPINLHERGFDERHFDLDALKLTRSGLGEYVFVYAMEQRAGLLYSKMTARHRGEHCAILVRGVVRVAPKIQDQLAAKGVIAGGISRDEIHAVIAVIKSNARKAKR